MAEALCGRCSAGWMVCDKEFLHDGRISEFTQMVISKTAQNPNIYGALIVGQPDEEDMNRRITDEIRANGTKAAYLEVEFGVSGIALEEGLGILKTWEQEAKALKREPVSMAGFTMAVHCGGSDWTTALSGNPTFGRGGGLYCGAGRLCGHGRGGLPGSEHILARMPSPRSGAGADRQVLLTPRAVYPGHRRPVGGVQSHSREQRAALRPLRKKSTGNKRRRAHRGVAPIATVPRLPGAYVQDQPSCGGPSATAVYLAMARCPTSLSPAWALCTMRLPHMMTIRLTGNPETFRDHEQEYKLDFNAGVVIDGKPSPCRRRARTCLSTSLPSPRAGEIPQEREWISSITTACTTRKWNLKHAVLPSRTTASR